MLPLFYTNNLRAFSKNTTHSHTHTRWPRTLVELRRKGEREEGSTWFTIKVKFGFPAYLLATMQLALHQSSAPAPAPSLRSLSPSGRGSLPSNVVNICLFILWQFIFAILFDLHGAEEGNCKGYTASALELYAEIVAKYFCKMNFLR